MGNVINFPKNSNSQPTGQLLELARFRSNIVDLTIIRRKLIRLHRTFRELEAEIIRFKDHANGRPIPIKD